jgi:hypothetical protein
MSANIREVNVPRVPNRPSLSRRRLRHGAFVVVVAIGGVLCNSVPAQAQTSVPRFIPTRLPSSYSIEATDDVPSLSTDQYVAYFHNDANNKAIATFSESYSNDSWKSTAKELTSSKTKTIKVHGQKAFIETRDGKRTLTWYEKNRLFTSYSVNIDLKIQQAFANASVATKSTSTSFVVKKPPTGFTMVFTGQTRELISGFSRLTYVSDPQQAHNHLYVEVLRIDKRYIDVFLLTPLLPASTAATVHEKPGYVTQSTDGTTQFWWEEQPGLLVEVSGSGISDTALLDIANSVAPTDEATWKALSTEVENSGGDPASTTELVGAGMVDTQPWTTQLSSKPNCLVFTIADSSTEACVKSPNSLGWTPVTVKDKSYGVGVAAGNVVTVVALVNAVEVSRAQVGPVVGQPLYRLFVVALPTPTTDVTLIGLDASGKEVQAALAARK